MFKSFCAFNNCGKIEQTANFTAFLMSFFENPLTTDDDYPGCDMCDCPHRHYW